MFGLVYKAVRRVGREILVRLEYLGWLFRRPEKPALSRYEYQKDYIRFQFSPQMRVLDIGSGGDPFPNATVLADRYLEPTHHRSDLFQTRGKPVVICDIHALPFAAKSFDYVVCAHVLEHVHNPISACRELQRVAHAGFVETPTLAKDMLFSWARGMHKWHLMSIASRLVFFEYSERKLSGIGSDHWAKLIFSPIYHPLQRDFNANQDLWNVMLEWTEKFSVTVMYLDGRVETDDR